MNVRKTISQRWRGLSITTKFTAAFGLLLALIVLLALGRYATLATVSRHTQHTISTSAEIQRLALEMNGHLEKARRQERDFFLRYPAIGFVEARQTFVPQATAHISQAAALSAELQQLIAASEVSDALRESDVNLTLYLSAAGRYAVSFGEAVELVAQLAAPETGLEERVRRRAASLLDILQAADAPDLILLYQQMRSSEKDYWLTRQRPLMQSAFNTAVLLREAIELAPTLEADQKTQALTRLDDYLATAQEILGLDIAIHSKRNEFDLQADAIDPISEELIDLANKEVEHARTRIERANQVEMGVLATTAALGLTLAIMIALALNNSITRNVVKLTLAAGELQAGNLERRVEIDSGDELGQLAGSFNAMAARINALVSNLEQEVAQRTAELTAAVTRARRLNEQLQKEIAERQQAQQALEEYSQQLEDMVDERTRELREAQEQLVRKEKMAVLGRLAGGVAHELRNPLGAIKNAAYFLNLVIEQPAADIQKALLIMDKEVGTCENIISSLLRFVRAGPPVRRNVELQRAIQEALSRVAVPENVETLLQLDDTRPSILADPRQLEQVFDNLVLNAVQAMTLSRPRLSSAEASVETPGGGRLLISSQVFTPGWLDISFGDTGEGILQENLDKLFEPLFTTRARGIGLGLAMVKKLVEGHGGTVRVQSRVGEGSTFTIRLPIGKAEQEHV